MAHFLYTVAQLRATERTASAAPAAAAALPAGSLMARAGRAAADYALELLGPTRRGPVLLLAGPGNNGGDALEVAANLADAGVDATVLHLPGQGNTDVSSETAAAYGRARAATVGWLDLLPPDGQWRLVIDGLFGIGLTRALGGEYRAAVAALADLRCPILALDVPSGLDADTGAVVGTDGVAVRATHTITFIADKPGLHTADGRDHAGSVRVDTLGIDAALLPPSTLQLSEPALFGAHLRARRQNTHKGSFGDVVVIGGAHGMAGAPMLAARGALYAGAGRVMVGSVLTALHAAPGYDSVQPEIMVRSAADIDFFGRTLVLGPGMGDSLEVMRLVLKALESDSALVVDADALNLIGASPDLQARLARRTAPTLLTPHPLEAARMLGTSVALVQGQRLEAARTLAARMGATVILKGAGSIIARPDGQLLINPTGNAGLATAGSGDVLAGICGALLAQGWPAWEGAAGAAWLHGAGADALVESGIGPIGMTAGELPAAVRGVLNAQVREAQMRNPQMHDAQLREPQTHDAQLRDPQTHDAQLRDPQTRSAPVAQNQMHAPGGAHD